MIKGTRRVALFMAEGKQFLSFCAALSAAKPGKAAKVEKFFHLNVSQQLANLCD